MPAILAFSGSLRAASWNQKLVAEAAAGARETGADVEILHLSDYPLPVFDQDYEVEHGLPEPALALKNKLKAADGLLIASPEYNSSLSAALKNMIDWTSRRSEGETPLACWRGKVAGLMAASPGGLGGLRGLVHLRSILSNIGVLVIPDQRAVSNAHEAFADDGTIKDQPTRQAIHAIGARVAGVSQALRAIVRD